MNLDKIILLDLLRYPLVSAKSVAKRWGADPFLCLDCLQRFKKKDLCSSILRSGDPPIKTIFTGNKDKIDELLNEHNKD